MTDRPATAADVDAIAGGLPETELAEVITEARLRMAPKRLARAFQENDARGQD